MSVFVGRLFGPGLPGTGIEADGSWWAGRLGLLEDGREIVAELPAVDAYGFNAAQLRVSWSAPAGEFAFLMDKAEACAAFAAAAPSAMAGALRGACRTRAKIERRFRWGWAALVLLLLLPVIAVGLFLLKAEVLSEWFARYVPVAYEQKIGDLVLTQTRVQMRLIDAGPAVEAVRTIGQRLVPESRFQYRWFIAERPEINAFAAPGGVVMVFSGLLKAADTPEEVAGVLAHEIAHAELRHGLRGMFKSLGMRALLSVALGDLSGSTLAEAAANLSGLKFSRDAERAADRDGLRRLAAAGVDPHGMTRFFERLAEQEGKSGLPALLSTHPATEERLADLQAAVAALGVVKTQPLAFDWAAVKSALPVDR